jgi:hypothetical protein
VQLTRTNIYDEKRREEIVPGNYRRGRSGLLIQGEKEIKLARCESMPFKSNCG